MLGLLISVAIALFPNSWSSFSTTSPPGGQADLIVDRVGYIPTQDLARFQQYLSLIRDESGIDLRVMLVSLPNGSHLADAAVEAVERLQIGRTGSAQRGLLLLFDVPTKRLKVEVGYGLEAFFPDVYIAFLVDRHAPLFFATDDRSLGLRQLLRLLQARIRDATLGGHFDPSPFGAAPALALSGGAGATRDLQDATKASLPRSTGFQSFRAGRSPSETYARYLSLMAGAEWDPDADIFTAESRSYLRKLPLSRAYRDFILQGEYGKSSKILVRGDLAMLFFTGTPFASPHFFLKEEGVWRIDLIAELRKTKERVGGPLTWTYEGTHDQYTEAFSDTLAVVQGYRRIAAGDNRALPIASRSNP